VTVLHKESGISHVHIVTYIDYSRILTDNVKVTTMKEEEKKEKQRNLMSVICHVSKQISLNGVFCWY
jgi:hypothetical protein